MAILYHPSLDPSRVYYGTDTRALELLVGAALAMVWPSRRLRRDIAPQARADRSTAAGVARPGRDRADVLAGRASSRPSSTAAASPCSRSRRCSRSPRWPIPASRLGADRRLPADALDRRALLRDLPLALPDHRPHHARRARTRSEPAARDRSRSRRSSASPSSPGATSRTRSATAPSAGSGGSWRAGRAGGASGFTRRGWAGRRRRRASVVAIALAGLAGVGVANSRRDRLGQRSPKTVTAKNARRTPLATTRCEARRPHRRLDLGGPGLRPNTCPTRAS